ncbi:MAG: hypothetical protein JWQ35_2114 [Bacteriovoracaceae bacterium]|nr:hypothetical protein [Bacteriovoracaceae bacterium]
MIFRKIIPSALIVLVLQPSVSFGWGQIGHIAIWDLAQTMLSAKTKAHVDQIFKSLSPKDLAKVAVFPDEVRRSREWNHTASYHFADIPKDTNYLDFLHDRIVHTNMKHLSLSHSAGDVVLAILRAEDILRNPSSPIKSANGAVEDQLNALRFLIHFIGDVHQPLHVAYPGDKGGNEVTGLFYIMNAPFGSRKR